jgi:hypothetical protein
MALTDDTTHLGEVAAGAANDNYYVPVFPNGGPPQTLMPLSQLTTYVESTLDAAPVLVTTIEETGILYSAFTDGGSTVGTFALTDPIPAGAFVLEVEVDVVAGFANDTSAVLTIGDGTDVDRFNTGTPSVFATAATGIAVGRPSGRGYCATAATVTLTVTTNADFTSVNAGNLSVRIRYILLAAN